MSSRAVVAVALLLLPDVAAAQRSFDSSAGVFWGGHAPDGPVTAGWVQSGRLLDQWVYEGTSRVDTVFETRGGDFGGEVRVTREDGYGTLLGGLRSPSGEGWVGFYYQFLVGGFRIARTMMYESDTVDIEAENARCGTFGGMERSLPSATRRSRRGKPPTDSCCSRASASNSGARTSTYRSFRLRNSGSGARRTCPSWRIATTSR